MVRIYACRESYKKVRRRFGNIPELVSQNALKANPDKFHLLLSLYDENISVILHQYIIYNSKHQGLFGVFIDNNLNLRDMLVAKTPCSSRSV